MNRKDFLSGLITGFTVGVILMALIFMSVSCSPSPDPSARLPEVIEADDSPYELIGCIDHVCTYLFSHKRGGIVYRCFLSVGSYPGFGDAWMFDLECP